MRFVMRLLTLFFVMLSLAGVSACQQMDLSSVRAKAETGDAEAETQLGFMYLVGQGVEKDKVESFKWYSKAAQQGYPKALYAVGAAYYNGDGIGIDDEKSYIYFRLASHAGYKQADEAVDRAEHQLNPDILTDAKMILAENALGGRGMVADPAFGVSVYKELADAGDPKAEVRLAKIYILGVHLPKDRNQAEQLCSKAAKQEYSPAMVCMGFVEESSELGTPAYGDALRWYKNAAKLGNSVAMFSLASMYAKGEGTKPDNVQACAWMIRAARRGLGAAAQIVNRLQTQIPPEEFKKAMKEAGPAPISPASSSKAAPGTTHLQVLGFDDMAVAEFPFAPTFPAK